MEILDLVDDDLAEALVLNRAAVPAVGDVDRHRLEALLDWSSVALAARDEHGALAGFLLGLAPGSSYDSENYRFFDGRYESFVYVDRVVVAEAHRSAGLGGRLYDEVAARSAGVRLITAEVNLVPPNPGSMRFHERRGFRHVGVMENEDATHRVQFLAASLP